tara:strand:- start:505 stop:1035 length:531 start_codon:yes stop_codon:yes gene_type:complete
MPVYKKHPDDEDAQKYIEHIESLGFENHLQYRATRLKTIYGANVVHITPSEEKAIKHKFSVEAANYPEAMTKLWETMIQTAVSTQLKAIGSLIKVLVKDKDFATTEEMINNVADMLSNNDFAETFFDALYQTQPDMIVLGNPEIVGSMQIGSVNQEEASDIVEKLIKDVLGGDEEE